MMEPAHVRTVLRSIETARRQKLYKDMESECNSLLARLDDDISEQAWRWRSKVSYERHMAAWQQGDVSESLTLAHQSVREANRGKDPVGALFATMNIAGHLFPAMGRPQEGIHMIEMLCVKAKELVTTTQSDEDHGRTMRVLMNCYVFRIQYALKDDGVRHDVEKWLDELEKNPIFVLYKGQQWADDLVRDVAVYVTRQTSS